MVSKRRTVTLSEEDALWLDSYSRAQNVSVAEAIRRGIKCFKDSSGEETYQRLIRNTRGIWKRGEGLAYQEKIRSEWDA